MKTFIVCKGTGSITLFKVREEDLECFLEKYSNGDYCYTEVKSIYIKSKGMLVLEPDYFDRSDNEC